MSGPHFYFIDQSKHTLVHIGQTVHGVFRFRQQPTYNLFTCGDWMQFLYRKSKEQIMSETQNTTRHSNSGSNTVFRSFMAYKPTNYIVTNRDNDEQVCDLMICDIHPCICDRGYCSGCSDGPCECDLSTTDRIPSSEFLRQISSHLPGEYCMSFDPWDNSDAFIAEVAKCLEESVGR